MSLILHAANITVTWREHFAKTKGPGNEGIDSTLVHHNVVNLVNMTELQEGPGGVLVLNLFMKKRVNRRYPWRNDYVPVQRWRYHTIYEKHATRKSIYPEIDLECENSDTLSGQDNCTTVAQFDHKVFF